eukprot:s1571_g8.t2
MEGSPPSREGACHRDLDWTDGLKQRSGGSLQCETEVHQLATKPCPSLMLCSWLFLLFQPLHAERQLLGRGLESGLALASCQTTEDLQLWVDWSLRPPGRAQLLDVQLFSEVEEEAILIAQLQRHGDLLTLKDVRQVALHERPDSHQGLLGQRILYGSIDFAMDGDDDLLGLIHSCHGRSPSSDSFQAEQRQALAFTLEGELQPGYQVQLSQSDWVMPLAWAFSFEVIEGQAAARAGGAIQILARVLKEAKCFNEDALLKNLRSLSACSWVCERLRMEAEWVDRVAVGEILEMVIRAAHWGSRPSGRRCEAMKVGGPSGLQTVQYQLDRAATKFELKDISSNSVLICWNVSDILLRKGEDADTWPHKATLTAATLAQSLEISVEGGGHGSWCLVAKNQEERDRFVCAIQILQLYHSLQNQLATNFSTPKKSEMEGYGEGGVLRPPASSPATSLVSPFARTAPAPPPTPQKLEFSGTGVAGL